MTKAVIETFEKIDIDKKQHQIGLRTIAQITFKLLF
ncbi:Uncharacterised protein [Vibrio cholerae]|nr:Uncharacterised protein [Vibrio cholerae]